MATTYMTPGIYVEEVSTGPKPLEAGGTSTAGFVGRAPNAAARLHEAVAINNWSQFIKEFCQGKEVRSTPLSLAVYGFFENGGRRCFIVNIGDSPSLVGGGGTRRGGLDVLREVDEVAIVAAPGFTDPGPTTPCSPMPSRCRTGWPCSTRPRTPPSSRCARWVRSRSLRRAGKARRTALPRPRRRSQGARARASKYGAYYCPWISLYDPSSRRSW